ncbi:MAG: TetR/AcrR family transcriptional regulator [Tagaea sp.]|nr:TetR/AcrR family transcriptional regulator [Tagaea sp.]
MNARPTARDKILDATFRLVRERGFTATSVDDLCAAAGVTKGAFFHHFDSKESLGIAAAEHWSARTGAFFAAAPYHAHRDPLTRVLGYLDFRKAILRGDVAEFTCLVGTMVQEIHASSPPIRAACDASISDHAAKIETDIQEALDARAMKPDWTARSLALHTQAVLQGAFILAKAKDGAAIAAESIEHLKRYVRCLFEHERKTKR